MILQLGVSWMLLMVIPMAHLLRSGISWNKYFKAWFKYNLIGIVLVVIGVFAL